MFHMEKCSRNTLIIIMIIIIIIIISEVYEAAVQIMMNHASNLKTSCLVAILPDAWHFEASIRNGWLDVSML